MKYYDLNIKNILKNWKISDAIREIIANAIDESVTTKTQSPIITKTNGKWIIEDFGRGISISHFSQDENKEKLNAANIIGKFGIGLKDSIAVLFRNKINFSVITKEFTALPVLYPKTGFTEKTIHMGIKEQKTKIEGTRFVFENVNDLDIEVAKNYFLIFQNLKVLYENQYGQIIKSKDSSKIYVNGMQVSVDENYTFSYNITRMNQKLLSKMNRERRSLGRDAYSEAVEKIITPDISDEVTDLFIEDEDNSGELTKKKIRSIIYEKINKREKYVFVTQDQLEIMNENKKEIIQSLDKEIKVIKNTDENLLDNLYSSDDATKEYNENFNFEEIDKASLSKLEKENLQYLEKILFMQDKNKSIIIVKKNNILNRDPNGYWSNEEPQKLFIVKRILLELSTSIITLIHEYAHSLHGYDDSTRDFENDLGLAWYQYSELKI